MLRLWSAVFSPNQTFLCSKNQGGDQTKTAHRGPFQVNVERSGRSEQAQAETKWRLRELARLRVHHGHASTLCPPPPPPNTINTANEGRFRLNVDSPYGERAQLGYGTHARRPARSRWGFHFQLEHARVEGNVRRRLPSPCRGKKATFDSLSADLLATAANIFGWAGDPTE